MDAGREELLKSAGAPAMEPYMRSACTKPEFDRLDRFFAQYGCANNDISDALTELVVISWEFVKPASTRDAGLRPGWNKENTRTDCRSFCCL
jgi:hypothetical protein